MAMLQLGGTLSNATVRITPRVSWWITAQHLLSATSMSTIPNPVEDSMKNEKITKASIKSRTVSNKLNGDGSLITAAFKSLLDAPKEEENIKNTKTNLNDRINAATNVKEVLSIVDDPQFSSQNAYNIVYVLCNWITLGKIKMSEIQNDKRYIKICKILGIKSNLSIINKRREDDQYSATLYGLLQAEKTKKQIEKIDVHEMITVLSTLASKQKRTTPLLKILTSEIVNSNEQFNIKELGDILYSVATLTYYDESLMKKTSQELFKVIPSNDRTAVIGSILTSLGLLRYRDEPLLDLLSTWIVEHKNIIRPQEITSLLKTLAYLGYTPKNFQDVIQHIIAPLKESEMCHSSDWLDIVWALTVLNQSSPNHYASVLNNGFLNRLFDVSETVSSSKVLKLLNVNSAARLMISDYKEPLLPENSRLLETPILRSKEKTALSNSIISALKILLPTDSIYLNININTKMGFLLDAEFCVDSKCTPLPVNSKTDQNKKVFRIGVLTCAYHEFCRGTNNEMGPVTLCKILLEKQGYEVLLIPYTKINIKDKLVTRVKYINDNIKLLVQNSSTQ